MPKIIRFLDNDTLLTVGVKLIFLEPTSWGPWEDWSGCREYCGEIGTETRIRRWKTDIFKNTTQTRNNGSSIEKGKCVATCTGG